MTLKKRARYSETRTIMLAALARKHHERVRKGYDNDSCPCAAGQVSFMVGLKTKQYSFKLWHLIFNIQCVTLGHFQAPY